MRIRLWGTRGSIPSTLHTPEVEKKIRDALLAAGEAAIDFSDPAAINEFIASLPLALRGTAGGDTSCIEVRSQDNLIIFDCGSGMRLLGQALMKEDFGRGQGVAHIFLCHTHWDHMMGWPFFTPAYVPGNKFYIYGVHPDLEARFRLQQTAPSMFPISLDYQAAEKQFVTLEEGATIEIGRTRIRNMRFYHPGDSYGYRVQDDDGVFIYAGDSEYKTLDRDATQHAVDFFRNADALVFDAMFSLRESYQKEDWGHSSAIAGADLATRAGVRRLLLFHHDPYATDEEIWSLRDSAERYLAQHPERPPCEIIVAYDGLELELWRSATLETSIESLDQGIVVHLSGRLVTETAQTAQEACIEAITMAQGQPVAVDLSQVYHVGPEGVNALLMMRRLRANAPIALAGLSSEVRRAFTQVGALDLFAVADTPKNALKTLHQGLDVAVNQVLDGRYKIIKALDREPLGDKYLAIDQSTHRQVDILVICPSLGNAALKKIKAAAQNTLNLRHPLIAGLYHLGQDGPIDFVVYEHCDGKTLRHILENGAPINPVQAVKIGRQIAQALEFAHRQDLIHGALAPETIVISNGSIKITHWGIGWLGASQPYTELPTHLGPLDYLAPEQINGRGASPASDLYALGIILYEMLTGNTPFAVTGRSEEWISLRLRQPPVPPTRRNPNLSRSFEHLVLDLLEKSPQARQADAGAVRQLLTGLAPQPHLDLPPSRDRLRQEIRQHIQRAAEGRSAFVTLHGAAGIGKTHLLKTVTGQWNATPLVVLHNQLFADEPTFPFKPFTQALQSTLLHLPAHKLARLLNDLGELERLLSILIPGLRPGLSAYTASQHNFQRLGEAICQTLQLLSLENPVILILEGFHWADAASIQLLAQLTSRKIPRLLVIVTQRTEEMKQNERLQQTLESLRPLIDQELEIPPLTPIDVHQITSTLKAPPDMALWLYGQTGGNPLHIEQLVQLYQQGPPSDGARPLGEGMRSMSLGETILRRLEGLPDGALATLRQAAVLGQNFGFSRLRVALDQPEKQILSALNSALQAEIIQGNPTEDRYAFSRPYIREVIYSEMLSGLRKRYHQRAARALEQEGTPALLDTKTDMLAYHYAHAGLPEEALTHLARAVKRARTMYAFTSALDYLDQAIALVERLSQAATDPEELTQRQKQRADLLAARAEIEELLGQYHP